MSRFLRLQAVSAIVWLPVDMLVCYLFETTSLGIAAFSLMMGAAGGLNALRLERK